MKDHGVPEQKGKALDQDQNSFGITELGPELSRGGAGGGERQLALFSHPF